MGNETITAWRENKLILIYTEVAEQFGLKENHIITTEDEFWKISNANASMGLAKVAAEKARLESKAND